MDNLEHLNILDTTISCTEFAEVYSHTLDNMHHVAKNYSHLHSFCTSILQGHQGLFVEVFCLCLLVLRSFFIKLRKIKRVKFQESKLKVVQFIWDQFSFKTFYHLFRQSVSIHAIVHFRLQSIE